MGKASKNAKTALAGTRGPNRKYYCPVHDTEMKPIKVFGKKRVSFECQEGCRMSKSLLIKK